MNYTEYNQLPSGEVALIGRVKYVVRFVLWSSLFIVHRRSHPDVAQRHYPELFKKYFPTGLPPTPGLVN